MRCVTSECVTLKSPQQGWGLVLHTNISRIGIANVHALLQQEREVMAIQAMARGHVNSGGFVAFHGVKWFIKPMSSRSQLSLQSILLIQSNCTFSSHPATPVSSHLASYHHIKACRYMGVSLALRCEDTPMTASIRWFPSAWNRPIMLIYTLFRSHVFAMMWRRLTGQSFRTVAIQAPVR